jgi:hypothetical protein
MGDWRYSCTVLDIGAGRRWVVSFTPGEIAPSTNWIGEWTRSWSGTLWRKQKSSSCRDSNPDRQAHGMSLCGLSCPCFWVYPVTVQVSLMTTVLQCARNACIPTHAVMSPFVGLRAEPRRSGTAGGASGSSASTAQWFPADSRMISL